VAGNRAADPRRRGSAHLCRARDRADPRRFREVPLRPQQLTMRELGGRDAPAGDLALVTGCLVVALLAYALPQPWAASIVSGVRQSALRPVVRLQARAEQD